MFYFERVLELLCLVLLLVVFVDFVVGLLFFMEVNCVEKLLLVEVGNFFDNVLIFCLMIL